MYTLIPAPTVVDCYRLIASIMDSVVGDTVVCARASQVLSFVSM